MSHRTGIAKLATGQAIVERAHGTLKITLEKQKRGMCGETPQRRITKAVYTLNHLRVTEDSQNPVILNNFLSIQSPGDEQLQ